MNKYVPAIHAENPDLTRRQIDAVLNTYHDELRKDLEKGDRAYIHGVCSLTVRPVTQRVINLPHMRGELSKQKCRLNANPSTKLNHVLFPE